MQEDEERRSRNMGRKMMRYTTMAKVKQKLNTKNRN